MLRKNPLKQLDLNLLRLFIYIFELKNLTHTAEALHLSQSAISHALGRLRQALGDELFYREKGELHPTLYAKRLYPIVKQSFENLEQIFQTNHLLSEDKLGELAQQSFATLTIAMHDEIELIVFNKLVSQIHQVLPNCQITSSRLNRSELAHELKVGQLDFAIDVARVVDSEIVHQPLLRDEFVLVLYAPNFAAELANEPTITQAQYFASQHITVSSRRLGLSIEDSLLSKAGWQRQSKIRCQHYATAFQLLKQDKLLLTLPRQLATTFLPPAQGWQILDLPIALTHIELHGYWHQQQVDPLYGWLRQQIFSAFN
ncbi:LysR family transcriptional regulator [Moraxella osloensis]|uniref:LysR family transcriptional regulator n=1 Tax=Faucicola osloensis TaxID=34062 RepID=A0A2D2LU08_FAUOS|nr:LysR family transcriptional regulator [Moraxella osloensis]ATR78460.1 LysR family transcriptional regulator [Moraxella osloensis]